MCTLVILRRPEHEWPVIIGANRDEMIDRPALPPARHWPDRDEVVGGLDLLAGGSWLGVNDWGVAAAILNRHGSLGPAPGCARAASWCSKRSTMPTRSPRPRRSSHLDPAAYRTFNLIVADNRDAFWLRHAGGGRVEAHPLQDGLSLIAAGDLDESETPRLALARPRFEVGAAARSRPRRVGRLGGSARRHRAPARRAGQRGAAVPHRARIRHACRAR